MEVDYDEIRDNPAAVGRGRGRVYLLVALAIGALWVAAYLIATYLFSL